MTRDDITRMAREAGFVLSNRATDEAIDRFRAFYNLAVAAEREACAKACEDDAFTEQWKGLAEAVRRIRARGQA